MEAPDKIYVPQHNIEAGNIQELGELIVAGSTEYIRKDTIEEILRKIKYQMNEGCSDCFDFIDWLRDFIDEQLEEC